MKFPTSKRFGIEGCDTLISGLGHLTDCAAADNVEHMVFGMPHRGRLNTLAYVFNKPIDQIMAEF
jgi:2-oxoglutarate dehydrogenase E1 component